MTKSNRVLLSLTLALALAAAGPSAAADGDGRTPPPAWYLEHVEFLARDGGVFHADNSRYRSDQEPWDAYGLAWEKGPSGLTLRGQLFSLRDGADAGTNWEFFVFWHPVEAKAYIYQVGGDGTLGVGTLEPPGPDGTQRSEQTFFGMDGTTTRIAHRSRDHGDTHSAESFHWVDGAWQPRRSYEWKRVRPAP